MQLLKVTANEAGQRLDKLLAKYLNQAQKGFLYKMMRFWQRIPLLNFPGYPSPV